MSSVPAVLHLLPSTRSVLTAPGYLQVKGGQDATAEAQAAAQAIGTATATALAATSASTNVQGRRPFMLFQRPWM